MVPLTGEVKRMSGFFLSDRTGEPAKTLPPSFTRSLGMRPLKSVGLMAITSGTIVFLVFWAAVPEIGMFSPCFKSMLFDIIGNL